MVDASAWVALFHTGDRHHSEAREMVSRLTRTVSLVTTTHFLLEAHKRLSQDRRVDPHARGRFLDELLAGELATVVVPEEHAPFLEIVRAHRALPPGPSLEDVAGLLTMRALGIRKIWAWDEDYRKLGVEVVP